MHRVSGSSLPTSISARRVRSHPPHIYRTALARKTRIAGDHERPGEARGRGRDLIGEIVLLRVAAYVLKRQHSEGRFVSPWKRRTNGGVLRDRNAVDADQSCDVLDPLLADVVEIERQPITDFFVNDVGDEYAARLCQPLQSGSNIDAVAINIVTFDEDIAQIDADAKLDPLTDGHSALLGHASLDLDGAAHRLHSAEEFDERSGDTRSGQRICGERT